MNLRPPPDHSKSVLAISVGLGIGIIIFLLTRSTLPHVGDNIHSLPHGGCYMDGTKRISYNSPAKKFPGSNLFQSSSSPLALIILVSACIIINEFLSSGISRRNHCSGCSTNNR